MLVYLRFGQSLFSVQEIHLAEMPRRIKRYMSIHKQAANDLVWEPPLGGVRPCACDVTICRLECDIGQLEAQGKGFIRDYV